MTTTAGSPRRPLPVPDAVSEPYWDAAAKHELTIARCSQCRMFTMPPDITCPHCQSPDPQFVFEPVSGNGSIRTWTVMRESFVPGFDGLLPFVLVDVELDEQPQLRLIGRLLDGPGAPLRIGDRVHLAWEDVAPGISLYAFELDGGS
jgi:uncharacterized OB-fold protein